MKSPSLENVLLPSDYDVSRVQMTGTRYHLKVPKRKNVTTDVERIPFFDFKGFRQEAESRIAYFQEKDFKRAKSIAEKVLRIITSPKYRAGSLQAIHLENHKAVFLESLNYWIEKGEPVKFMLPAFPFKIRNPLKSSRGDADLAEVASFCKFNEVNLQIQKIYSPGAQFHIFHDGHLYYRHFLHTKEDANRYFSSLNTFVEKLELKQVVHTHDAFEKLNEFPEFSDVYTQAREEMTHLWNREKETNKKIGLIRKSAADNLNLSDIAEPVLIEIATPRLSRLSTEAISAKQEISKRADACAFEYMVVQHALEKLAFFARSVPNGVRLTVHPKEGQIGIHLVKKSTYLLPWMGVGLRKKNGDISVRYEVDVKNTAGYTPVFIEGEDAPFYYQQVR